MRRETSWANQQQQQQRKEQELPGKQQQQSQDKYSVLSALVSKNVLLKNDNSQSKPGAYEINQKSQKFN